MRLDLQPHEDHLLELGWQGDIPSEIHCEDGEYDHVYHSWKRTLPHADHDTLHKKSAGTIAWKHHGPIGTKDVLPHIVQDAKLTESRAIKNHLREADLKHFPALKKELDDIEEAVKDGNKELVGLRADSATAADTVGAEVRVFQAGVEKLAEDSRQDLADAVKLATKFGWAIVALLSILILSTLFAPKAHAQFSKINSIQFQQDGTNITGAFFSYPFTINCTVNVTCSIVSGKLVINSAGGSGSPCTLSALSLQFNNAGAFGCVTGSSVSGSNVTFGGMILMPDGSVSAPSYSFTNHTNTGMYETAGGGFVITAGGVDALYVDSSTFQAKALGMIGFSASGGASASSPDTLASRCAANVWCFGNAQGDFSGTIKTTIVNAVTGFQVNGGATNNNCLVGNGTNFVSASCPGGGSTPTGTGFTHITAGVQDAASKTVDLSSSDVTGTLPVSKLSSCAGVDLTTTDVTATAGPDTIYTFTLSANCLGPNGFLVLTWQGGRGSTGTAGSITYQVSFGGTTLSGNSITSTAAGPLPAAHRIVIANQAATNSQKMTYDSFFEANNSYRTATTGTAAIDTTANVTVLIRATNSGGSGTFVRKDFTAQAFYVP